MGNCSKVSKLSFFKSSRAEEFSFKSSLFMRFAYFPPPLGGNLGNARKKIFFSQEGFPYVVCCAVIIVFIFNWNVDHHPKGRRRDNRVEVQTSRRILLIFIVFVFESILKLVTLIVSSDKSSSVYAGLLHTQRQRPLFQIWSNPIFTGPQIQNAKKTQHLLYFLKACDSTITKWHSGVSNLNLNI